MKNRKSLSSLLKLAILAMLAIAFVGYAISAKADELNEKQSSTFEKSVGVIMQTAVMLGQEIKTSHLGGGTLIAYNVIVTSAHVIPRNISAFKTGEVFFGNKKCGAKVIEVLAYDTLSDIAVLMLDKKPECMEVAKIATTLTEKEGICTKRNILLPFPNSNGPVDKDVAFGNFEIELNDIVCSKVNKAYSISNSSIFVFNAKDYFEPGFSGFPSLNSSGDIVGINSSVSFKFSTITHIGNVAKIPYFKF